MQPSTDEDWIALVGKRGWTALTKDKNIRFRSVQLEMMQERHRARVIVIRVKDSTGPDIARIIDKPLGTQEKISIDSLPEIKAPFVGAIDRSGSKYPAIPDYL